MLLNLKHDFKDCNNYIFFLIIMMGKNQRSRIRKKDLVKSKHSLMKMVNQLRKQNSTKYIKKDTYLGTRRKNKINYRLILTHERENSSLLCQFILLFRGKMIL